MRGLGGAAVVAAIWMVVASAQAQDAAGPASGQSCELHVWPAMELKSTSQGWVWNHTVNQAFDPSKGGVERPRVLSPARQIELLNKLDLPDLFKLGGASTTVHLEPLARTATSNRSRLSGSTSPCYTELVVSQNFYDVAPMAPRELRTLFVLRKFGDTPETQTSFSTWADTALDIFPAKTAELAEAADREISAAFSTNVRIFAGYLNRPVKKKK